MSDKLILAEAAALGDELAGSAVWHRGRCTWLRRPLVNLGAIDPAAVPTLTSAGPAVYSGTAGVALFLSRLARATGEERHREAALGAVRHAAAWAHLDEKTAEGQVSGLWRFSYYSGKLGIAYAAHEVGKAHGDASLQRTAARLVSELSTTLQAPFEPDLVFGAASGVPTLLRLGDDGVPGATELAVKLGDRLIEVSRPREDGTRSWPTLMEMSKDYANDLVGFSHGAAGIAWSLAELHARTGEPRHRDAAEQAYAYERLWFDAEEGNWPDFRGPRRPNGRWVFVCRWCHGAPGAGLSRALAHAHLQDPRLLEEAAHAERTATAALEESLARPGDDFTACCGVVGLAESLWLTRDRLGGDGRALARRVAEHGLERYALEERTRWPGLVHWPTGVSVGAYPMLMQGIAGIGHFLLRVADPSVPPLVVPPAPATASPPR